MDVRSLIPAIARQEGIDPNLLARVVNVESNGNPSAVSPKGARGPAQLMPATAKDLGVNIDDPADNIRGGARYLKQQMDRFGDPRLALAAYNAGPAAVQRAGGVPNYPETKTYVGKVMGDQNGFDGSTIFGAKTARAGQQDGFDGSAVFAMKPTAVAAPAASPAPTARPAVADKGPLAQFGAGLAESALSAAGQAAQFSPSALVGRILKLMPGNIDNGATQAPDIAMKGAGVIADAAAGKPQGVVSSLARTAGNMAPAALSPGSLVRRAANVVLPTLGSETGGALAKGTPYEDAARFVGGLAGGATAGVRAPAAAKLPPADLAALKAAKTAAYTAADQAGVAFKAPAAQGLAAEIKAMVEDEGGVDLYPKASAMAQRIENLAAKGDMSLSTLDKLRSQVGEKLMSGSDAEARLGAMMRQKIDGFIDGAGADVLSTGTGADASALIRNARDLNTRYRKVQDVTDRLDSADLRASSTYGGGNIVNATRQNLRPLLDPKSPQRMGNLTPDERAALSGVVRGTAGTNAVRIAGKMLDPRGLIGSVTQTVLGLPTHGVGPLVTAPLGIAATEAGKRLTAAQVERLLALMSAGGKKPVAPPLSLGVQGGVTRGMLPFAPGLTAPLMASTSANGQQRR
jgi:hypothetical protein